MAHYDYLIVGQGIAGTLLSHFLLKKGKRVLIVDQYNPSSSSNVGAGIFNPITGRRFVKTWKAESIFPFAETTYLEIEKMLGDKFYFRKNIVKILSNEEEIDLFSSKSRNPEFMDYIVPLAYQQNASFRISGAIEITRTGYLDMAKLVMEYKKKLIQESILVETSFRNEDLKFENEKISWNNHLIHKVIFCEGYKATENTFFSWLPFVPAKGEVLVIHSKDLHLEKILMKDIFVLPLGDNHYKVGSTYQWDNLDENPKEEGKSELVKKLDLLLDCPYTITDHHASIRPTVKDRKPLIGMHPMHNNIGIFNGMGTKGASLAPFFANHFVEFLEEGKVLDKEVNITRFAQCRYK